MINVDIDLYKIKYVYLFNKTWKTNFLEKLWNMYDMISFKDSFIQHNQGSLDNTFNNEKTV